ncbi:hypothetical protein VM98_39840, partial [Streptomyces rubellomurinus subsp. indigoferus]
ECRLFLLFDRLVVRVAGVGVDGGALAGRGDAAGGLLLAARDHPGPAWRFARARALGDSSVRRIDRS